MIIEEIRARLITIFLVDYNIKDENVRIRLNYQITINKSKKD